MKRSQFLHHVGWTGAGVTFGVSAAGVVAPVAASARPPAFSFVQISDSHIGFHQPANDDVAGTLEATVARINALPDAPAFVVHTGDITHLAKPGQFDDARAILGRLKPRLIALPGEHDVIGGSRAYFDAFGRRDAPQGWFSWDEGGAHFVALANVFSFETMGSLGAEQLAWLQTDLDAQKRDTPVVVFGHVPLYALYPAWGWTTADGARALAMLARFASVTVLAGHIHQVMTHVEGNVRFFTANATAYPQPAPGAAERPGPLVVPKDRLLGMLGYRTVALGAHEPEIADATLG